MSVGRALPTSSDGEIQPLVAQVGRQAVDQVVDQPEAVVHDAGAHLDGGCADEQEVQRVPPGLDAPMPDTGIPTSGSAATCETMLSAIGLTAGPA